MVVRACRGRLRRPVGPDSEIGMTETAKTTAGRRRRRPLGAARIAEEAMALVDEGGLDALSFRALAKRLGCEAMSIYHYYPSKQHLQDALVSMCLAEASIPTEGTTRERMRAFALSYRETAIRHAGMAPLLFTHRQNHREGLDWLNRRPVRRARSQPRRSSRVRLEPPWR
jgi:AcrR family transcriptional regulator